MKLKHHIILLLFSLAGIKASGQKTTYNWLFGGKTGISFNQGPPEVLHNSQQNTYEGCSSISDGNGKLLFYTNGLKVYNRRNELLLNGTGLLGDISSTCNSVVVKLPGSDSKYYIFVISASGSAEQLFSYSIVDMNGDNGLGEVVQKNVIVESPVFEKIAAVRHCNKKDVWIVTKVWDSDQYHSYLLTAAGLSSTPVVSSSGFNVGGSQLNAIGSMKFSANGKLMAAVYGGTLNIAELMDFNNATGRLTNGRNFTPNITPPDGAYRGTYGVEFSPNGKLLYVSSNNSASQTLALYQFDLTVPITASIVASRQLITERSDFFAGALQLGPDQKIYLVLWKDSALSVIENPDVAGAGCNFNYNKVSLADNVSRAYISESGLPTFIASDLMAEFADYQFAIARTDCSSKEIQGSISFTNDLDSVRWNFGDSQESVAFSPLHTYQAYGTYTVSLKIYRKDCGNAAQVISLSQPLVLEKTSTVLPKDTSLCSIGNLVIKPLNAGEHYTWNTGQTSDSIVVTQPGIYWLDMELNGCISRDSIEIFQKAALRIALGNDTTVCVEKPVTLQTIVPGNNYVWNDGTIGPSITVTKPGRYWLKFENTVNCVISDTVNVANGNCDIYFPGAFTPNGDGKNDLFGLVNNTSARFYELIVYNRFGEIVFKTNDQYQKWDGTSHAKKQPMGTYVWIMRFRPASGLEQIEKGTVLLIR